VLREVGGYRGGKRSAGRGNGLPEAVAVAERARDPAGSARMMSVITGVSGQARGKTGAQSAAACAFDRVICLGAVLPDRNAL
jgi:hypothetical protein